MAYEITDRNFNETINSGKLVLVDFWAAWCGPCRVIAPIIDQLAIDYQNKGVIIGKLNVEQNKATQAQFGIRSIPALLLFKNGQLLERIPTTFIKSVLEAKINFHLK